MAAIGLEELAVGLEAGELVGGGLGGPAGFALADGAAVGGGRGGDDAVGPGLLGDVASPRTVPASRPSGSASSVRSSPPGSVILRATLALSSGRYSASRTRTVSSTAGAVASALGAHGDLHPAGDVADEPADGLPPRSLEVALGRVLAPQAPPPEVADQERRDVPLAELLRHERGGDVAGGVAHLGEDHGPRLDLAHRLSVWNAGIAASRCLLFVLGLPQSAPRAAASLRG